MSLRSTFLYSTGELVDTELLAQSLNIEIASLRKLV